MFSSPQYLICLVMHSATHQHTANTQQHLFLKFFQHPTSQHLYNTNNEHTTCIHQFHFISIHAWESNSAIRTGLPHRKRRIFSGISFSLLLCIYRDTPHMIPNSYNERTGDYLLANTAIYKRIHIYPPTTGITGHDTTT